MGNSFSKLALCALATLPGVNALGFPWPRSASACVCKVRDEVEFPEGGWGVNHDYRVDIAKKAWGRVVECDVRKPSMAKVECTALRRGGPDDEEFLEVKGAFWVRACDLKKKKKKGCCPW